MSDEIKKLVRQLHTRLNDKHSSSYHRGVVQSVDAAEKTAIVLVGDADRGVEVEIQAQSGYLPAVDEELTLHMNGPEPLAYAQSIMVDGSLESDDYIAGSRGWIILANGDAEFDNVILRGMMNGIKPNEPPVLIADRTTTLNVPSSTWTTITGLVTTLSTGGSDLPWGVTNVPFDSSYDIDFDPVLTDSRIIPGKLGLWEVHAVVNWSEINTAGIRRLQLVNDDIGGSEDMSVINANPAGLVTHRSTVPVQVVNVTHRYSIRVWQDSGGIRTVNPCKVYWKFVSDV